jgi:hypothetical protein
MQDKMARRFLASRTQRSGRALLAITAAELEVDDVIAKGILPRSPFSRDLALRIDHSLFIPVNLEVRRIVSLVRFGLPLLFSRTGPMSRSATEGSSCMLRQ